MFYLVFPEPCASFIQGVAKNSELEFKFVDRKPRILLDFWILGRLYVRYHAELRLLTKEVPLKRLWQDMTDRLR